MSPDQIAAISSLLGLLKMLSSWPIAGVILFMVIGPWILAIMLFHGHRKRFDQVVQMYESNVRLLEETQRIATGLKELNGELKDVILLNSQAMQRVADLVETNQYCPMVRLEKRATGAQR